MKAPERFEVMEDYSCFRLSGHGSLVDAASRVIEAIKFAKEHGSRRLLIDTTNWTGHESPGTLERYEVASAFSRAAGSALKLAMVVRTEMMDPDKFEVMVAKNQGLSGNVFDSETDALVWLLDPNTR